MAEFDYAGWVGRARAFAVGVGRLPGGEVRSAAAAPPAAEAQMQATEQALGRPVAASLRAFFTAGAAGLDCGYALEPEGPVLDRLREVLPDETRLYGGASLGPISDLADLSSSVRAWMDDTWIAESPDDRVIWESALPFASLANGDYLALDLRTGGADPPVVYLSHDDESFVLSPNFVAFLDVWEGLCYIGPEHWLLQPFIGSNGHLDAASARAAGLRALFAR